MKRASSCAVFVSPRVSAKPFTVGGFCWYDAVGMLRSSRRFATHYGACQAGKLAGYKKQNLQVIDLDRY